MTIPAGESEERILLEIDRRWIDAFNAGDVDTLVSIYAPDVIVMPPSEAMIEGREAVREWIEAFFARNTAGQQLVNDEVVVAGGWAFMRGHFTLVVTPRAGGEPVRQRGKHLLIWRRQPDGAWKVARDIWNLDAP